MKSKSRKVLKKKTGTDIIKPKRFYENYKYWIVGVIVLTTIIYIPAFDNEITNWDDHAYITENPYIKDFTSQNVYDIFSEYYIGNYHPLTLLFYNIEYQLWGSDATLYFIVNLLLHLLNTFLLFYLIALLVKNKRFALIVALLFAIHPMHVESVAWLSELKDVLYTSFYFASLIAYIRFISDRKSKFIILSLVLFVLSLLSKGQAVTLSLSIIAIDYLRGRKILSWKVISEKIPYFALSIIFGIIAIDAQKTGQAVAVEHAENFFQQLIYAVYAYSEYIIRLLVPYKLSAIYPYPVDSSGNMPSWLYIYILLFALITWFFIYSLKNNRNYFFGILFYTFNIFMLLQLLPVGKAIIADRYAYIPSIGLFFIIADYLENRFNLKQKIRKTYALLFGVYVFVLSLITFNRSDVWDNSLTLWDDVLKKYPELPQAAYNRAIIRDQKGDYRGAVEDYSVTIKNDPENAEAYNNRGNAKTSSGDFKGAVSDLTKAIQLREKYTEAYYNRGIARIKMEDYDLAIDDFDTALSLNEKHIGALNNRGNAKKMAGDFLGAIEDYNKMIDIVPERAESFNNRGNAYISMKEYRKAISDFSKALDIDPNNEDAYYNRGNAFIFISEYDSAITDFTSAININPNNVMAYNNRGNARASSGDLQGAVADYDNVIKLNPGHVSAYFNRAYIKTQLGKFQDAISDLDMAIKLNPQYATAYYLRGVAKISIGEDGCSDLIRSYRMGYAEAEKDIEKYCR